MKEPEMKESIFINLSLYYFYCSIYIINRRIKQEKSACPSGWIGLSNKRLRIASICQLFGYLEIIWINWTFSKRTKSSNLERLVFLTTYRKIASSNTSQLEAHSGFFRLLMKGIFDPDLLTKSWFTNAQLYSTFLDKNSKISHCDL